MGRAVEFGGTGLSSLVWGGVGGGDAVGWDGMGWGWDGWGGFVLCGLVGWGGVGKARGRNMGWGKGRVRARG